MVALSAISGYLLVPALQKVSISKLIRSRFITLIVPVVFWNAIGILVVLAATYFLGMHDGDDRLETLATPLGVVNGLTGFLGETFNMSLFFLRDLFVSAVLIAALWRWIAPVLPVVIAVVFALTVFDAMEPVVFRPTILLFMLFGCWLCDREMSLRRLSAPLCILLSAGVYLVLFWCKEHLETDTAAMVELVNIAKRCLLLCLVAWVAFYIVEKPSVLAVLLPFESVSYLSYLSHVVFAAVAWRVMVHAGLVDLSGASYMIYFFGTPVLVFLFARAARPILDGLPGPLQIMIQGKNRRRRKQAPASMVA